jgi:sulfatase modifying factor 1
MVVNHAGAISIYVKMRFEYFLLVPVIILAGLFFSCGKMPVGPHSGRGAVVIRLSLKEIDDDPTWDSFAGEREVPKLAKILIDISEAVVIVTGPGMEKIEQLLLVISSEQRASGTIEGVPAGSDRNVRVELKDDAGQLVYFGETVVTVETNRTAEANINLVSIYERMVFIPAGEFDMGSNSGSQDESPMHTVFLDSYWIDKYEVTNIQYVTYLNEILTAGEILVDNSAVFKDEHKLLYLEDEDCQIKYKANAFIVDSSLDNFPVICVSWYGAVAYAEHYGKRLPSEAEWEKAARGTDNREYPWGNTTPSNLHCNFDNYIEHTIPIGQYSPMGDSPYGCSDMAGNVNEWCADWYDREYYSTSPSNNPQGPSSGSHKIIRGGSWKHTLLHVRCVNRDYFDPLEASSLIGFRCVR